MTVFEEQRAIQDELKDVERTLKQEISSLRGGRSRANIELINSLSKKRLRLRLKLHTYLNRN